MATALVGIVRVQPPGQAMRVASPMNHHQRESPKLRPKETNQPEGDIVTISERGNQAAHRIGAQAGQA